MDSVFSLEKNKSSVSEDDSGHSEGITDNVSLLSDQSEEMAFSEAMVFDDDGDDNECVNASPRTNVLVRLDSLLREKINSEVAEFQENLHQILDQHVQIERRLMKLCKPPKDINSEDECSDMFAGTTYTGAENPLSTQATDISSVRDVVNEKNQKLIELFTSVSVISATLRRPEFAT